MMRTDMEKAGTGLDWSTEVYRISKRISSRPPRYKLRNAETNNPVAGAFYEQQLMKIGDTDASLPLFKVQRVIRKRFNPFSNEIEVLVQFNGMPHSYWIAKRVASREPIVRI